MPTDRETVLAAYPDASVWENDDKEFSIYENRRWDSRLLAYACDTYAKALAEAAEAVRKYGSQSCPHCARETYLKHFRGNDWCPVCMEKRRENVQA